MAEFNERYIEDEYDAVKWVVYNFKKNPHGKQQWEVVSKVRLKKIWTDFSNTGFVRDSVGLDNISEQFIKNIWRLYVNGAICGHTQYNPTDYLNSHIETDGEEILTEEEFQLFYYYISPKDNDGYFSDYAHDMLFPLLKKLYIEQDDVQKLLILDMMLNVIHQRFDLASCFVEGGKTTLNELFGFTTTEQMRSVVNDIQHGSIKKKIVKENVIKTFRCFLMT